MLGTIVVRSMTGRACKANLDRVGLAIHGPFVSFPHLLLYVGSIDEGLWTSDIIVFLI